MGEAWRSILDELRRVMIDDEISVGDVDAVLDRVAAVFSAVERGGGKVDLDLGWSLIGLIGEKLLRQRHRTGRRAVDRRSEPIRRAVAGGR